MDAAVLALVDEQVGARGRTATSDCPTQSPLWAQYTLVHDAGTVMLQAAILAICRADLVETAARTGRVVIGPSTLPGAGLGAIALGLVKNDADRKTKRPAQGKWHLPYLGPLLRAEDVPVELTYAVHVGGDKIINGEYAACVGAVMNHVLDGRVPDAYLEHYGPPSRPHVRGCIVDKVQSQKVFVDYYRG